MVVSSIPKEDQGRISYVLRSAISLAAALVTLILGTVLPVLTGPKVASALVNVVWGSFYGIGFWMVSVVPEKGQGAISFVMTCPRLSSSGNQRPTGVVAHERR